MKIVFMGTPEFSVGALEAIIEAGHQVTAVVTQPDKPKGRGKEMQFSPVKETAIKYGIPVFQPVKIKTPEAIEILKTYEADVFLVAAFGQLLSKQILEMPKFGCVNIHASLLPKYRGAAPIQWSIIDGEKETGVTIMQMDVGIDTGDMLTKTIVPIAPNETGDSLHDKLSKAGAELIVKTLVLIEEGKTKPQKQDSENTCYAKMLTKVMGDINWNKPAIEIERLIRGLNSWPSAYTFYKGKTLKIWEALAETYVANETPETPETPETSGIITEVGKDFIRVACGEGSLKITQLQLEGKKRMAVKDFLLGYNISVGESLESQGVKTTQQ